MSMSDSLILGWVTIEPWEMSGLDPTRKWNCVRGRSGTGERNGFPYSRWFTTQRLLMSIEFVPYMWGDFSPAMKLTIEKKSV